MTTAIKLTPARRRALNVLADCSRSGRTARVSNETTDTTIYWQSADWLDSNGLAVITHGPTGLFITPQWRGPPSSRCTVRRLWSEWWPLFGAAALLGCTFAFLLIPASPR